MTSPTSRLQSNDLNGYNTRVLPHPGQPRSSLRSPRKEMAGDLSSDMEPMVVCRNEHPRVGALVLVAVASHYPGLRKLRNSEDTACQALSTQQ